MGIDDIKVKCALTDQQVNLSRKGSMSKCGRCEAYRCEAKKYPMRKY